MKTKIKRHYRSAVSILLSVCMLISCMTVGLIATDAARIDADEAVGDNFTNGQKIYLDISNCTWWMVSHDNDTGTDTERYPYMYLYGGSGNTWVKMKRISTTILEGVVPAEGTYSAVIFVRKSVDYPDWNNVSNQTIDLAYSSDKNRATLSTLQDGSNQKVSWESSAYTPTYTIHYSTSSDNPSQFDSPIDMEWDSTNGVYKATITGLTSSNRFRFLINCGDVSNSAHFADLFDGSTTVQHEGTFVSNPIRNDWNISYNSLSIKYYYVGLKINGDIIITYDPDTNTVKVVPASATVTLAKNPSDGGTAEISSDGSSYQTTALSNIDIDSTVFLRATAATDYEFSEWGTAEGLSYTSRTNATTTATVSANATATAKFLKIQYNLAEGTFEHGTISVSDKARWDSTVTPKVTADKGYKVKRMYYVKEGETTENVFTGSFTMPKSNVTVYAEMETATQCQVNFSVTGSGTVTAMGSDGKPVTSGGKVYEGTEVTFTATPNIGYLFTGWSGLDGNTSIASKTITENTTVTATFVKEDYHFISAATSAKMKELSDGLFITTRTYSGPYWFKILRDADNQVSKSTASDGGASMTKYTKYQVQGWEDKDSSTYGYNNPYSYALPGGSGAVYVVYDSINDKVYFTDDSEGYYPVTVYLKRGTVRYDTDNHDFFDTTANFGDFTVVKENNASGNDISLTDVDTTKYSTYVKKIELTAAEVKAGKSFYMKAQCDATAGAGYYVKGFDVNGGLTGSVISQEFDESTGAAISTGKIPTSGRAWNDYTLNVNGYPDDKIVVTILYAPKVSKSSDVVRFYAYDFTDEVKEKWGGYLAVYPYIEGSFYPLGKYPGQLMVNEGGVYYTEVPTKDSSKKPIQGMTMNNYVWDDFVYNTFLESKAKAEFTSDERTYYNRQTYDYDEFAVINKIFEKKKLINEYNGESIIFSFKYKASTSLNHTDESSDLLASNLGRATYYEDINNSTFENGELGYNRYASLRDYTDTNKYQWEDLTDFYKHRVDIFGQTVDDVDNTTKQNYHPIRIISNGYDHNNVGYYATAWALYKPVDASGNDAFDPDTTVDHYVLFDVIGGQGVLPTKNGSESFLIDPDHSDRVKCKYGDADKLETYRAAFRTAHPSISVPEHIMDCEKIPVLITYEYEALGRHPNEVLDTPTSDQYSMGYRKGKDNNGVTTIWNWGNRSDGRWYFSDSNQLLKANTLIEIADKKNGPYVRDYYQANRIDYTKSGYLPEENTGIVSGVTANFTNSDTVLHDNIEYFNHSGYTEAYALSDNKSYFKLKAAVDTDENYTFEGWYLKNGDKYALVSNDPEYNVLAKTNDVYVARFYNTPSGAVKISHELLTSSVGTAATLNSVQIVESDGTTVVDTLSTENENATVVKSKYIKADSTNKIKIVIDTDPATGFGLDNFWYDYTKRTDTNPADVTKLENQTADPTDPENVASFDVSVDIDKKKATILVPVKYFFVDDPDNPEVKMFDTSKDQLRFFSELKVTGKTVNITKTVTGGEPDDAFTVKVETSDDGTTWIDYASQAYTSTNDIHSGSTDANGLATIYRGETISFTGVAIGTYVRITETNVVGNYKFRSITAKKVTASTTDADSFTTDGINNGCSFKITDDDDVNVTVNNELEIAYEITYTYDSRANLISTSTAVAGTPKYGTPSYTVNGIGFYSDVIEHSDTLEKDIIKKSFAEHVDRVPYEKNFMQTLEWNFNNIDYTKEKGTKDGYDVYYCTVTGQNKSTPKVSVEFYFPYQSKSYIIRDYDSSVEKNQYRGTIYGPDGTPEALGNYTTQSYVNQAYQSNPIVYAIRTRMVDGEEKNYDEKFGTFAAPSVGGQDFAYWSIRARSRTTPGTDADPNYVEVARCYETTFNYALFDDYRVYAMYKGQEGVNTEGKATDKYTTINFLDYSRNHWNNGNDGDYPYEYTEGDVIWTDFDVAFENGEELINKNSSTEVGVLFTLVQNTLDPGQAFVPGSDGFAAQYQYYYNKYNHADTETVPDAEKKSTWVNAAKEYIKGTENKASTKDDGNYSKRVLNATLNNKNRTEYGYAWFINQGQTTSAEIVNQRRNGLYRAVTYIRNGNEVILSDTPVYICLSNEASKSPVSPAPTT